MDEMETLETALEPVDGPPLDAKAWEIEGARARQREVCRKLLERWLPLAVADELALRKEGRSGPVIDDDPFEAGLKAGGFVLKVLERLARLDGLDSSEKHDPGASEMADPVELARRVQVVSPVLAARLEGI